MLEVFFVENIFRVTSTVSFNGHIRDSSLISMHATSDKISDFVFRIFKEIKLDLFYFNSIDC